MAVVKKRRGRKGSHTSLKLKRDCSKADTLKSAAVSYFLKGGYSCFTELGVNPGGSLRADMLAVNLRRRVVLCEIKSSVQDYRTDTKWKRYIPYCNRMYFVMCPKTFEKLKVRLLTDLKSTSVGVMVLNPDTGFLDIVVKAGKREIEPETTMTLITRMAWRGGISKRTNRRTRHYLQGNDDGTESEEGETEPSTKVRAKVRRKRGNA